jgi:hypothetical protein
MRHQARDTILSSLHRSMLPHARPPKAKTRIALPKAALSHTSCAFAATVSRGRRPRPPGRRLARARRWLDLSTSSTPPASHPSSPRSLDQASRIRHWQMAKSAGMLVAGGHITSSRGRRRLALGRPSSISSPLSASSFSEAILRETDSQPGQPPAVHTY